jgi:hypothetical protein
MHSGRYQPSSLQYGTTEVVTRRAVSPPAQRQDFTTNTTEVRTVRHVSPPPVFRVEHAGSPKIDTRMFKFTAPRMQEMQEADPNRQAKMLNMLQTMNQYSKFRPDTP